MTHQLNPSGFLILTVDDDTDNLTIVSRTLQHEGFRVEKAQNGEQALQKLKDCSPDLVLLDINMPGISGLQMLKHLRPTEPHVPIIFVSARSETEDVIRGLDAGADDYICKPFDPHELLARVRAQLRIKDLTARLAAANSRLQELVDIDDLTGLYNMRSIYARLDNELVRAKRYDRAVSVVMMDIDNFKKVNDNHDHLFGSFVLSEVGKIIRANIRSVDFAARYGGDEFLVALPETSAAGAELFANRLRTVIEAHVFTNKSDSMKLTASLGVGVAHPAKELIDGRGLVRTADHALYEAKRLGKNRVHLVDLDPKLVKKIS
jgi:two-component system, cell cycle response regulator